MKELLPSVANPAALYEEVIRAREDIIRYAPTGVILGDTPQAIADTLFNRYVERRQPLAA